MQPAAFFDPVTGTVSYVVHDGRDCALIDPVLDFDARSGRSSTAGADAIAAFVRAQGLRCQWILETHAHADHLSAAPYLQRQLGGKLAIGQAIREVQTVFKPIFNLALETDGSQFDHLFTPDERFMIGSLQAQAIHVPGHTPADMAYRIGDAVFVGDTLFMPDVGTARCDFPGGDATQLYRSIRRLLDLPPATRLFVCHDYPPEGRQPAWETTVAAERQANIHVRDGVSEAEFVAMRRQRDAGLAMPTLMLPAIQVNIQAGALPEPEDNGTRYLKIPLDRL
ncbi:MBL fold metallo-hydrolase [Bordetella avium]|uniref:Metallo-beta-lactamase superfamily protein n=1 Tax=Bordetella avium (strain 197N) TaxID=360910 RepID=Q2L0T9_BORA1|nr:MBL fold metallo-hydrolase [Bordetella avium]AZY51224.1 MBL fold metallo-hydrolase [Bordetella avium]RIQ14919.1 MBL fold metallo-hydrolase [Bordetella avium]RIQ18588.1 MBL fold metallo-hydrolase [Bordetella avium]RIQ35376.1 MBL fold metallo-hydrolase [Bordetella avium]RIQ41384.1 MBL fold metallo-hydrolase [Bordetella avium]